LSPNYVEAQLRLAQLNLETGAIDPAIEDLTRLVAAQPRFTDGYILLGTAYLKKKEPAKALDVSRKLVAPAPKGSRGPCFVALALLAQQKRDEARKAFEDALVLAPGSLAPLRELVRLDVAAKKPEAAVARVQREIAAVPTSAALQHLLGKV